MTRHAFTTNKEWKALKALSVVQYKKLQSKGKTQREIAQMCIDWRTQ